MTPNGEQANQGSAGINMDQLFDAIADALSGKTEPRHGTPAPCIDSDTTAWQLADAVPFASVTGQSVLDISPDSPEEAARRQHISAFVIDMIDSATPDEKRAEALRHVMACDPLRAIGLMAAMSRNFVQFLEHHDAVRHGALADQLRSALAESGAR